LETAQSSKALAEKSFVAFLKEGILSQFRSTLQKWLSRPIDECLYNKKAGKKM
jgi:hypothetical protein